MDKHPSKLYKELQIYFIASIVLSIFLFIVVQLHSRPANAYITHVLLERYGILFTLAGIPAGLKFFHTKLKKMRKTDITEFRRKYKLNYIIRLGILETVYFF